MHLEPLWEKQSTHVRSHVFLDDSSEWSLWLQTTGKMMSCAHGEPCCNWSQHQEHPAKPINLKCELGGKFHKPWFYRYDFNRAHFPSTPIKYFYWYQSTSKPYISASWMHPHITTSLAPSNISNSQLANGGKKKKKELQNYARLNALLSVNWLFLLWLVASTELHAKAWTLYIYS